MLNVATEQQAKRNINFSLGWEKSILESQTIQSRRTERNQSQFRTKPTWKFQVRAFRRLHLSLFWFTSFCQLTLTHLKDCVWQNVLRKALSPTPGSFYRSNTQATATRNSRYLLTNVKWRSVVSSIKVKRVLCAVDLSHITITTGSTRWWVLRLTVKRWSNCRQPEEMFSLWLLFSPWRATFLWPLQGAHKPSTVNGVLFL